jgi:two-component system nitrate/nitrite response regulator NarL
MSATHSRPETVRILIADDHALFRQGLRKLLEEERSFRVVGEAADGAEAVQSVQELKPDVLLLDISMPRHPGLEALHELETSAGRVRTIVLAASIEKSQMVEALEHGARGVVMKECASDVLMESIRTVMAGHYWIGREKVFDIVRALRELQAARMSEKSQNRYGLTGRELQIITKVAAGYTNKDIAKEFSVSERTVKHHLTSTFDKVGVSTRLELALFAVFHNLSEDGALRDLSPVKN